MEKDFLNDILSRCDELQAELDELRARLDAALSESDSAPFPEPVDISLPDFDLPASEAASGTEARGAAGLPAAIAGPENRGNGPSMAQAAPAAPAADGSPFRQVCPPSDTLEGGAQPSGWEGWSERSERNLSGTELPSADADDAGRQLPSEGKNEGGMPSFGHNLPASGAADATGEQGWMEYQWAKDIPGGKVGNMISALSLNDRVLLINTLFKEDPLLFQSTVAAFNSMSTLGEAYDYVRAYFPDWNLSSETVYRLMMAVRRKLD